MDCSMPGFPVHHQLLELTQTRVYRVSLVIPSNCLILCHLLLLPPSIFPSIRVFSKESVLCIGWPKYWSFSFSISASNEHPGLISFRMDWLDLLTVQGTLKSLLQHHSSKASILWCSAFFRPTLTSMHDYWNIYTYTYAYTYIYVCILIYMYIYTHSSKESACQCRTPEFDPWVGKIPQRRKWQPTPVFLPGKSHGQRSFFAGYSPRDHKRVRHNLATKNKRTAI